MRNYIAFLGCFCLLFHSCIDKQKITEVSGKNEAPSEYMYSQRAYPDNIINQNAIRKGIVKVRSSKALRSQEQGGSWSQVGPFNTGGRITDLAIDPSDDATFFIGTSVGGIFKTTDHGLNWTAIFDDIGRPSIGNIAIAPSNSQVIYAGTGEANGDAYSGTFFGDGVYRSANGGDSWIHVGLPESGHIGRIVVDPTNENRVFAAATGILYGTNEARGIYRTTDGGTNWEHVLFIGEGTAAIDIVMNPTNPNILHAAMWERTREPWQRDYGGITSVVHRSIDGGDTWTALGASQGLPEPDEQTGRIGLAVSASTPATVYARFTTNEITNQFNGIYKSIDNGENWNLVVLEELQDIDSSFGWYFGNIRVNPNTDNEIYVLGQRLYKSGDGGAAWEEVNGMHVDHHAMEFSTNDPNFILAGNDGGVYASNDAGETWNKFTNLPITQFYNIEVDFQQPERLYGGTQDNNTIRTIDAGILDWNSIWGGDGFHVSVDPIDNNFIYVESQFGRIGRSIDGGATFDLATDGIDSNDRNNWNSPKIISPFDHSKVFFGTNRLYISDFAETWTPISPDLTDGQHPSGALSYGTLTAIAPSYNNLEVIYTGSDDGNVNVTLDGGATWSNVTNNLPDRYITSIAISPTDDLVAYVTLSGFQTLDYTPHVFKTENGGQNWSDISGNLPSVPANDIIINSAEEVLFLATDLNVWNSIDDGLSWEILGANLPITITADLKLHEPTATLYAGTYGRSMFSYDVSTLITLGTANDASFLTPDILLYPNPASTQIHIKHNFNAEGKVSLIDTQGREIKILYKGVLEAADTLEIAIDDVASGFYFVKISEGKEAVIKGLLIQ